VREGGEAIPTELNEVMCFYEEALGEVSFPDIDLEVLCTSTQVVRERAEAVERARAALEEARASYEEAKAELRKKAERAVSYAKVYADGDAELAERISSLAIVAMKPKVRKPAKKRRTRKKQMSDAEQSGTIEPATVAELPFIEAVQQSA
jgi:hypothetical protein